MFFILCMEYQLIWTIIMCHRGCSVKAVSEVWELNVPIRFVDLYVGEEVIQSFVRHETLRCDHGSCWYIPVLV